MVASASTPGLMNSVLEKLASLMLDDESKHLGVHKQLQFLHRELSSMRGSLKDVEDIEDPDNQTKAWRNEVTELAYDIEDCIDDYRHRVESPYGHGFMHRTTHLLQTLMARYQISRKLTELRTRVQETSDRHTRYRLDECASRHIYVPVDPRTTAFYAETSTLVGIDAPKEEVIKLLTEVDDASPQELRVVSIVGFGGLGKTTLANEVYRNLSENFTCKAIISVSQRPEMTSLLKSLFLKVSGQDGHNYDLQGLIDNIREYLQGKRYLLVVDDLWDALAWEVIKCSFPQSQYGSRVLTTTRVESVAMASCNYKCKFVYRMKPLDDYHSRQLFLRRIFGSMDKCPEPFGEPCEKILQKCGGLPLAIITISSLLASQPTMSIDLWKNILSSLRHNLGLDPTLEGMRQVLNLSYTHLPHPLKTCLMYIGMYPEDYEIQRDPLVIQLVAEGVISGADGREAMEVAGSYLNELVNRSMITQRIKYGAKGGHISYRVHDMVLDLILSRSTRDNLFSAIQNLAAISTTQHQYKARRLSLQFDSRNTAEIESAAHISLSHVRSLMIFGWPLRSLGPLELKFLRVLYIKCAANGLDLTLIDKLFQLRYLHISGNCRHLQLPEEISRLQHLEALHIASSLCSVPRDLIYLPGLLYLQFPPSATYPNGIGNLKFLHTLGYFDPSKQSVANISALGELLNLKVLNLLIGDVSFVTKTTHIEALLSSLEKLISCNLKILSIFAIGNKVGHYERWSSLCFSFSCLEELDLYSIRFPKMPTWVCQLRALSNLEISVVELCEDAVVVLARLPALTRLHLDALNVPRGGVVFSSDMPFMVLSYLRIPYIAAEGITFEAGSMPQVQALVFRSSPRDVKQHGVKLAGIEHLPKLKQILVDLLPFGDCDKSQRQVIKEEIESAFDAHAARSSIRIKFSWYSRYK